MTPCHLEDWEATQLEVVYCNFYLKVYATRSRHQWRWAAIPAEAIERYGKAWFNADLGKGASKADARGRATSAAKACAAAVAAVDAIFKDAKKKKR